MFGAVIGDICGSCYEFVKGNIPYNFPFFNPYCIFTDDTVMTMAIADVLLDSITDFDIDEEYFKHRIVSSMKKFGRNYIHAGYGKGFYNWIISESTEPYYSYGNGSAMRVSPIGWAFDDVDKTRKYARLSAEVTHNHPEGIKGAECTAAVIFLARTGHTKEEIRDYVEKEFDYEFMTDVDPSIDPVSCMTSLPIALNTFFTGDSYEKIIRKAICYGFDTDTNAAIAGSMAEAYYGIPEDLKKKGYSFLTYDLKDILDRFEAVFVKPAIERRIDGRI